MILFRPDDPVSCCGSLSHSDATAICHPHRLPVSVNQTPLPIVILGRTQNPLSAQESYCVRFTDSLVGSPAASRDSVLEIKMGNDGSGVLRRLALIFQGLLLKELIRSTTRLRVRRLISEGDVRLRLVSRRLSDASSWGPFRQEQFDTVLAAAQRGLIIQCEGNDAPVRPSWLTTTTQRSRRIHSQGVFV